MRHAQRGMTMIGWVIVLAVVGLFASAAIRLVPVYMENMKITGVLRSIKVEFDGKKTSTGSIRKAIAKRFNIEAVNVLNAREINIKQSGAGYTVSAKYDHRAPFIANVNFLVSFDDKIEIRQ